MQAVSAKVHRARSWPVALHNSFSGIGQVEATDYSVGAGGDLVGDLSAGPKRTQIRFLGYSQVLERNGGDDETRQ